MYLLLPSYFVGKSQSKTVHSNGFDEHRQSDRDRAAKAENRTLRRAEQKDTPNKKALAAANARGWPRATAVPRFSHGERGARALGVPGETRRALVSTSQLVV